MRLISSLRSRLPSIESPSRLALRAFLSAPKAGEGGRNRGLFIFASEESFLGDAFPCAPVSAPSQGAEKQELGEEGGKNHVTGMPRHLASRICIYRFGIKGPLFFSSSLLAAGVGFPSDRAARTRGGRKMAGSARALVGLLLAKKKRKGESSSAGRRLVVELHAPVAHAKIGPGLS